MLYKYGLHSYCIDFPGKNKKKMSPATAPWLFTHTYIHAQIPFLTTQRQILRCLNIFIRILTSIFINTKLFEHNLYTNNLYSNHCKEFFIYLNPLSPHFFARGSRSSPFCYLLFFCVQNCIFIVMYRCTHRLHQRIICVHITRVILH